MGRAKTYGAASCVKDRRCPVIWRGSGRPDAGNTRKGQKIVATTKANDGLSVVQESEQLIISNEGDIIHDIYGNGRTQQFG